MSKKTTKEETPTPIGLTARNETTPLITFQQFFDLMRVLDSMNNIVNFIKQENFNADNLRYYFPEDLVEVFDKEGNPVMIKNQKGELVQDKQLRGDFWTGVEVVEEPKKY